ncbi:helix-turn-helix transcriptional regulator [Marinibaculum pumilum]|uniref:Helix-turn-helix transcriptional regulator n=1 Tax=Marinibaculum pumilum TaxID=1766165 RepID=A0ABV7KYK2_9PROT
MTARLPIERLPDWPFGLDRTQAATYLGVGVTTFDEMVGDGRMPPPREIGRRRLWPRPLLEAAFLQLPGGDLDGGAPNPWDDPDP